MISLGSSFGVTSLGVYFCVSQNGFSRTVMTSLGTMVSGAALWKRPSMLRASPTQSPLTRARAALASSRSRVQMTHREQFSHFGSSRQVIPGPVSCGLPPSFSWSRCYLSNRVSNRTAESPDRGISEDAGFSSVSSKFGPLARG